MIDLRTNFITWYFNDFHLDELYINMVDTVENSPYHREVNVGIHTDMVLSQYISNSLSAVWNRENLLGAFAAAFHDVGKPAASKINGIKFKPERGNYLSFGGHELISARLWEDYATCNWTHLQSTFGLDVKDIYLIGWMIEHHLPWGVKKPEKRRALAQTIVENNLEDAFINLLNADTWGRISDDGPEKKEKVRKWVVDFFQVLDGCERTPARNGDQPTLFVPIGASGTGKSTFRQELVDNIMYSDKELDIFSLDDLRLDWYIDEEEDGEYSHEEAYSKAFERSCDDKQFASKANARFVELTKNGNDLYVDNTNTSGKRRRFYIAEARRRGYFIQAVVFPVSLQTVIDRQKSRQDKDVPDYAVKRQYMGLQLPSYGDFDAVSVIPSNL